MVNQKTRPTPLGSGDIDFGTFLSFFDDVSEIFKETPLNWGHGTELLDLISTKERTVKESVGRLSPSTDVGVWKLTPVGEVFVHSGNDSNAETSVPPSVLFQSPDKVSESGQNVKVKRKCGRPRNPIPRHKRVSHLSAEHRRRTKIQDAFRSLKNLVPPQTHISGRVSKADVLFRAVDTCQDLERDIQDLKSTMQSLRAEKEALSLDVKAHKASMHDRDTTDKEPVLTLDDLYANYVQERSRSKSCSEIFTLMMTPLFESFKMAVKDQSAGQFLGVIRDWAFEHLTLPNLRAAFVNVNDDIKDHGHEMNVPPSMADLISQTAMQVLPTCTAEMPTFSHRTNPFQKSLAAFKKRSCLQSIQDAKTLPVTSEKEHFGKDSPVDRHFHSASQPGDQNVAAVGIFTGSPCFALDGPNECLNSEYCDCSPPKFHTRCTLNDENLDLSKQNSFYGSYLNSRTSFYQNKASGRPQLDSKNSTNAKSPPFQRAYHDLRNTATPHRSISATMLKDMASFQVNHVRVPLTHAGMPGESDRSTFEKITPCFHSSHESCRHTDNLFDPFPTRHPTENSPPSYDAQCQRPTSVLFSPGDQTSPTSGLLGPKINQIQSSVRRPALRDKSHHLLGSYSNSHRESTIAQSLYQDQFHSCHTVHHLPHETACLPSPWSHQQDQIKHHESSNRFVTDDTIIHQEPSLESPVEYTPHRPLSFLSQLLGTPNSANQNVHAFREESERISFLSDVTTPNGHITDSCQISPNDRSESYQPISSPASHSSLLSPLDFAPRGNRSSGSSCRFTAQSKLCQKTSSLSEPSQCPAPDTPTFMPFVQASYDQISPGIHDNMWSVTRSDQVISPCSDDAIQREFTSPKTSYIIDTNFGEIRGQGRDSLTDTDRMFTMECQGRQRKELLPLSTSPRTYINMDANQIVPADDESSMSVKQLRQLNVPLGSYKRSDASGLKMNFEPFRSPLKRKYSDFN